MHTHTHTHTKKKYIKNEENKIKRKQSLLIQGFWWTGSSFSFEWSTHSLPQPVKCPGWKVLSPTDSCWGFFVFVLVFSRPQYIWQSYNKPTLVLCILIEVLSRAHVKRWRVGALRISSLALLLVVFWARAQQAWPWKSSIILLDNLSVQCHCTC